MTKGKPKDRAKDKDKPKKSSTAIVVSRPSTVAKSDQQPTSVLAIIARAASDPKCDPGKMRELLQMQKEIDAEEARRAFTAAFLALTQDLPTITADKRIVIREKTSTGQRDGRVIQSTPYASYNAILKVLKPILQKHGFTLSFSTEPSGDRLLVRGYLDHVRGGQRTTAFPLPAETSGSKNNIQGWGSSQSYGMRYCTRALLNIISHAPEDADTDGAVPIPDKSNRKPVDGAAEISADDIDSPEPQKPKSLSVEQSAELVSLINESGVGIERFLSKYMINAVIDLDPKHLEDAKTACRNYAKHAADAKKKATANV